jgi:hypothetical protein
MFLVLYFYFCKKNSYYFYMTENTCPEVLRPSLDNNGVLRCNKEDYPVEFFTMEGNSCCAKDLKVRKKLDTKAIHRFNGIRAKNRGFPILDFEPYRNIDAFMAANNIDCPDLYCNTYGSSTTMHFSMEEECEDEDNDLNPIEFGVETFNRSIPMSVDMCDKLKSEMPSQQWLDSQKQYVDSLSEEQRDYLELYSHNGDVVLNLFIRNGFSITEEELGYIQTEDHMRSFSKTLSRFIQKGGKNYQDYLMDFYNSITMSIMNSPVLDKNIVLYRGHKSDKHFHGLKKYLYRNLGIMSCSALTHIAMGFAEGQYMNRIVVPKGYVCLMHAVSKILPEFEFILPDNALFYVTKTFTHKLYVKSLSTTLFGTFWLSATSSSAPSLSMEPVNINTNEIVLVHEKNIAAPILNNIVNIHQIFQEQVARKQAIADGSLEALFDNSSLEAIKTTLFTMFKEALSVWEKYNYENILQNYNEKRQLNPHFEEIYYLLEAQNMYEKIVLDNRFDLFITLMNASIKYIENVKKLPIGSYVTYIKNNYIGEFKDEILGSFYELQIIFSFNEENFNELLLNFTKNNINTIEYSTLIERYTNIQDLLKDYEKTFETDTSDEILDNFENSFNVTVDYVSQLSFILGNLLYSYESVIRKLTMHSILNKLILTKDVITADNKFSSIQEKDDFDYYKNAVNIDEYIKIANDVEVIDMLEVIKDAFYDDMQMGGRGGRGEGGRGEGQYGGMWQRGGFFMTCS